MFVLQEKVKGKFKDVSGKFQYGAIPHAQRRAEKDYGGKLKWEITGLSRTISYGADSKGKIFYQIIKRSDNPMKKKRKKNADTEAYELGLYADNLGPSSQGLENDVYEIRQKFLAAIKKGRPKKELVNLTKHAAHRAARAYSKVFGSGASAWQEIFSDSDLNKAAKYLYDSWEEESDVKLNPKRKRKVAKKKRTAKQKAATRKLVAFNKARRGKKTTRRKNTHRRKVVKRKATKRRVVRRRNPQKARPGLKKSHLWMAFVCWPKGKVSYAYITDTVKPRVGIGEKGKSVLFKTKSRAHNVAKLLAKTWPGAIAGVANANATVTEIRAACRGKA